MKKDLKSYILLWSTQSLSTFGSSMTGYALVLWLYLNTGSALKTSLLAVCSYAPYVAVSIFAGALSDRWNKKKTMLVCDCIAAASTAAVFALIKTNSLEIWHLYLINALNGLMNTVQQPAGEVAATMLIPPEYYQKTASMRSFSQSLTSILTPAAATALFTLAGLEAVIAADLATFAIATVVLLFFIRIPETAANGDGTVSLLRSAKEGILWLKNDPLIMKLIMFLAFINLTASIYDAALPAMLLSKKNGGESVLGAVNTCVGIASLAGSVITAFLPSSSDRVRAVCISLLISMSTENFMLAFGNTPVIWCIGAVLGWLPIPYMNANLDVIFRTEIPAGMQGRVFSCRNTFQFFTIPLGLFLGGILTDSVFEPFMSSQPEDGLLAAVFGSGKGSGTAMLFFVIGISGVLTCLIFWNVLKKYKWAEKKE